MFSIINRNIHKHSVKHNYCFLFIKYVSLRGNYTSDIATLSEIVLHLHTKVTDQT